MNHLNQPTYQRKLCLEGVTRNSLPEIMAPQSEKAEIKNVYNNVMPSCPYFCNNLVAACEICDRSLLSLSRKFEFLILKPGIH